MLEMTLIALILKTVIFGDSNFKIITPNIEVYITRFITSLLLHMELIEDVKQGLFMIHYLNTHPEDFSSTFIPFLIGFMQMSGGLLAEFTNIFMLATRSTVADCVTFFVAFHVLNAIDNIYAEGISDFSLKEALDYPLIYHRSSKETLFINRTFTHKIIRCFTLIMDLLYNTIYYYYTPFVVNFIPYLTTK